MAPEALAQVLRPLKGIWNLPVDENYLIGLEVPDDAAVYRLAADLAIVVTVDFFTPVVDDPYHYGAIAAANSLSDIYAMGARPLLALNVAGLPATLDPAVSAEIFRGGAEKAREAGVPVAGGHTVRDHEPKYGLVVVGTIDPAELTRKGGARPGDRLLLTKALGAGVVTTALMRDAADPREVEAATESMMRLNDRAAAVARACAATAATDITGFGLLGHAIEMAERSGVRLRFTYGSLPWLPGSRRLAEAGHFPGGAHDNRSHFSDRVDFADGLDEVSRLSCYCPETSGGLLMAVPPERIETARQLAAESELEVHEIGSVERGDGVFVDL